MSSHPAQLKQADVHPNLQRQAVNDNCHHQTNIQDYVEVKNGAPNRADSTETINTKSNDVDVHPAMLRDAINHGTHVQ
ncbi:hypothetical protein HDV02_002021 [Globomyces sp. JEL0801]|nr:hypothetical protein HDV02_002021 [Globomyces sp. JEL0801]